MSLLRVAVIWRVPLAMLLGCAAGISVYLVGDAGLHLPMADGPRLTRQAVLLVFPLTLSVLLTPPLPTIHASLMRSAAHHWVSRGLFWMLMAVVCSVAWSGREIPTDLLKFEMTSTFTMTAAALFLVPRFGGRTIVGLTLAGCAWLLYGVPLGRFLGFGDLQVGENDPAGPGAGVAAWLLLATSVLACVVSSAPTKPARQP